MPSPGTSSRPASPPPPTLSPPPPPLELRSALPNTLSTRSRHLRLGHAYQLWHAHDWNAKRAFDTTIHTIHPNRLPSTINDHLARTTPAQAFRRIYSVPFAPPLPAVAPLLLAKVPTGPNPDLNHSSDLVITAADILPQIRPNHRRSARIHDPTTRASVIETWSKAIRAHPGGAPDGTGTRTAYLLSPSVLPLLALLLDSIRRAVLSPAHRHLLTTKTTSGQCKQLSDGTYPTSVAQIEAVRPLCRHSVLRRHCR